MDMDIMATMAIMDIMATMATMATVDIIMATMATMDTMDIMDTTATMDLVVDMVSTAVAILSTVVAILSMAVAIQSTVVMVDTGTAKDLLVHSALDSDCCEGLGTGTGMDTGISDATRWAETVTGTPAAPAAVTPTRRGFLEGTTWKCYHFIL